MTRQPQVGWLRDGKRLHLQDGPIDLIVEAEGSAANRRTAYDAAIGRFTGLLDELCDELSLLRTAADPVRCALQGTVARRMHAAVAAFAADHFITPMAAVAGSVAEEILESLVRAAPLDRAYVNNGGDIALHLTEGEAFTVGLIDGKNHHLIGHLISYHQVFARRVNRKIAGNFSQRGGNLNPGQRPLDRIDGKHRDAAGFTIRCIEKFS